ncbi:hypothetical protein, conserved [Plasmodium gonderi]|uniref:Uncharacterized protein n=1 Tax=Plasmodium gonderi TaxID=77519 RepID=A0A1Y1JTA4_PLAGO|nr:hypothetical protein, conserved [Plasmodium gonderi]GAW83653.1 hypothetical protein, conserved [Plasmodium gonderi]
MKCTEDLYRNDPIANDEFSEEIKNLNDEIFKLNNGSISIMNEEEKKTEMKKEAEVDACSLHPSEMRDLFSYEQVKEGSEEHNPNCRGGDMEDDNDRVGEVDKTSNNNSDRNGEVDKASNNNCDRNGEVDKASNNNRDRNGEVDKASNNNSDRNDEVDSCFSPQGRRDLLPIQSNEVSKMDKSKNEENSESNILQDTLENNYEHVQVNILNFDLTEEDSNAREERNEDKPEDSKMKLKIENLLKLIGLLKAQINQKDHEIYKMELDFKLKKEQHEKNELTLNDILTENESCSENTEGGGGGGGDFLIRKMKSILISQNEEIISLNEELKKKSKELFYLNEENMTKNEKLAELKKEIEQNYMHLKEYKNMNNEIEVNANNKMYRVENCLNLTNKKLMKNDIYIKENKLNMEKQKRVIKELYNQLNKKEEQINELRSIIESIELNNSRDIIKYKQNNTDLINRLSLNNSLMNSQKIEIENMHMNYKQLEEELKNKDNELKKLHKGLLAKDEENRKMLHDMNRLKFDMEIKNIDVANIKQKINHIKKECAILLKKQKDRFTSVINEIYKEKDEIIKNHLDEFSKLNAHYNEALVSNENVKNEVNILKDELLKKSCEMEKLQDKLLDYESKLLVYENNNEIKILKKNEDHLRKLLNKHTHRNEKLLNTTLLLQKSTLENNTLEKKIIELKAETYRKDQEIKKLQETNSRNKNSNRNINIGESEDVIALSDDLKNLNVKNFLTYGEDFLDANNNNPILDYKRRKEKNNALDHMLIQNENNLIKLKQDPAEYVASVGADRSVPLLLPFSAASAISAVSAESAAPLESAEPVKLNDDPVSIALYEFGHSLRETNIPFKFSKISENMYLLNDKKVFIKFINGDLYIENDVHQLVKLNDYLLKTEPS